MLKDKFYTTIATGFFIGKIPFAPGTFGSLLGVLIWIFGNKLFSQLGVQPLNASIIWTLLLISLSILGVFAAEFYSRKFAKDDAKEIVIDEICGQLLTLLIAGIMFDTIHNYTLITLGFIFFRLFDITKPFIIGIADRELKGGLGVMMDDLLAGFAAATFLYVVGFYTILT